MLTRRTLLQGVLSLAALGPLARVRALPREAPQPVPQSRPAVRYDLMLHGYPFESVIIDAEQSDMSRRSGRTDDEIVRGYFEFHHGPGHEIRVTRGVYLEPPPWNQGSRPMDEMFVPA